MRQYRDWETPKFEQRGTPIQIDPQKGETIEMKVRRITQNKEPITDVAQPIYMERGVKMASCDIRTDRWEVAREAKDKVSAAVSEKYQKRKILSCTYLPTYLFYQNIFLFDFIFRIMIH